MYVPQEELQEQETASPPGIVEAAKRFAGNLIGHVQTRLELLTVEWAQEKSRLAGLLIALALTLFFTTLAIVLASILVIVLYWDTPQRIPVMAGIVVLYLIAAVVAGLVARYKMKLKSPLFAATAAELRKDRELLETAS